MSFSAQDMSLIRGLVESYVRGVDGAEPAGRQGGQAGDGEYAKILFGERCGLKCI